MSYTIVIDTEVAPNGFLLVGKITELNEYFEIWLSESDAAERIKALMASDNTFVTFNGIHYDMPMISAVIKGLRGEQLKHVSDSIIEGNLSAWKAQKKFSLPELRVDHIDLVEVAPSFVGLKTYGARMNMPWLQDLPYHHAEPWTEERLPMILDYCRNDVDTTEELLNRLSEPMKLRLAMSKEYGVDMRSKSDTQMAETAFIKRLKLQNNENSVPRTLRYKVPSFIYFKAPHLKKLAQDMENHTYEVNPKTGHVILPEFLGRSVIALNSGVYQMGVGGIHSTHDKAVCHVADENTIIADIDAASFYPSILINGSLVPERLGQAFLDEYRSVYERRLEAKRAGEKVTAETLKISLNGTFGKLGSRWSALYAPEMMLAITLTGQLTLLSLIERLEEVGARALSANTDGIAMAYPKNLTSAVESTVSAFSELSGFAFEYTPYRALAMKDVNNYFAVKLDRSVKAKGIYAPPDLRKNPTAPICAKAVSLWLAHGTPLLHTVKSGKITEYLSARNVTGGGVQGERYLGKVVRWYSSTDNSLPPLTYAQNGNLVPKTTGARALMTMDVNMRHPPDLDYDWYYKEALRIAADTGCREFLTEEQIALITPPPKIKKARKTKEKKHD